VNDKVRIAQNAEMYEDDIEDGYGPGQAVTVKKIRLDEVLIVEAEDGHSMSFWPDEVEPLLKRKLRRNR
jgi:hypothetical protein